MENSIKLQSGRPFSIRWKMIINFLVFMVLIIFIGIYMNLGLKMSARFFSGILDDYKTLEVISRKIYAVKYYTDNYLTEGDYASLDKCLAANAELREAADWITDHLNVMDNQEKYNRYLDLSMYLTSLYQLSETTVMARRDNRMEIAYDSDYKLTDAADLTNKYLRSLMSQNITWGSERYKIIHRQTKKIEFIAYLLALVIALLSITFCINFSMGITQPLEQIVKNAEKIAGGNFKVAAVQTESNDELQIIARVFNRMSRNIHDSFHEIQEKVKLERQLKEEKMRNLEVTNLLRESEIQILQSQMNPHFLYNTLNAISQVAILEDATETGDLIKAVARLLRYNLRSLDRPVTIQDEVDNIKEYIYIMGVRYGERIHCELSVSGNLEKYLIPCMILQPLIENAYLHGVSGLMKQKGEILVNIIDEGDQLSIIVSDNGVGIPAEKLQQVLNGSACENCVETTAVKTSQADSTGLGLVNIRKRLRLFYRKDNLLTIASQPGMGTQVTLKLPLIEEDGRRAQFNDCG
jgi:Predicted signal transduction protein with a C-terminal ATPase domain